VLARNRVVLFHFELVRRSSLVLVRGIEMACTSGRIHSDLVSHGNSPLNLFTASANICQHLLNATLVDDTHAFAGYTQRYKPFLFLQPKPVLMQVGQKTPACAVLRV
jgi:hypothetical protein